MLSATEKRGVLLTALLLGGCRTTPAWQDEPLAPRISFRETIPSRGVVLLVLDAHSGQPLATSRAIIADAQLAPGADSAGRIRLSSLPPGPHTMRVVAIGHDEWRTVITPPESAGLALVVQLRRSAHPIMPAANQPDQTIGCYTLSVGPWTPVLTGDSVYHRLPARIQLDSTPVAAGGWRLIPDLSYPQPHRFPGVPRWSLRGDSLVLLWSNGFAATKIMLQRSGSGWAGSAVALSDAVSPTPPRATVLLHRVECRSSSRVPSSDTGVTRAPDGRIALIRPTPNHLVSTSLGDEQATELWIADADGTHARRLVEGTADDSVEHAIAAMSSPAFSPDSRRIYFLSRAWVTSDAVHAVDVDTGREWFVAPGNSLAVILRGPLAGCLLVGQHRYRPSKGGSYDWTWLLTGDGKEIALAATASAGADRRLTVWMSGGIPDGAFGAAGSAESNVRCS